MRPRSNQLFLPSFQWSLVGEPGGPDTPPEQRNHGARRGYEIKLLSYYGKDAPPPAPAPLTREEEHAAFVRYRKRKTAKDRELLLRQYLCWAFSMAARFKGPRLNFDEAISVANLGLMEALNRFDPGRGFRFTTYATFVIRRKLIEAIVGTYPVKASDHLRKTLRALTLSPDEQTRELTAQDEPRTLEEFFDRLGATAEVDPLHSYEYSDEMPGGLPSGESPADELQRSDLSIQVRRALRRLGNTERTIVFSRFYKEPPESFDSLGRRLKMSKNRAREIGNLAVVKMRRFFQRDL